MTGRELLLDAFGRIPAMVHDVVDGLTPDQLTARLDSQANSVAWLVWHLSRIEDDHVAELAGRPQVWTAGGWAKRWRLPFNIADTAATDTPPGRSRPSPGTPICCSDASIPCTK